MLSSRVQLVNGAAVLLGGLALLGVATTAIADPIAVYLTTTINWTSDFPFVPSTVSGASSISTDTRGPIYPDHFFDVNPVDGPTDLSTLGPIWINPGETILWSFGGLLSFGEFTIPVCAYSDFAIPSEPCDPFNAPKISIAKLMSDHFGSISVTGAVFAFDDTVRIGTWTITSHEGLIPEPATLALLGLGLAGIGFSRRKQ
jgi:hypothetical protein